MKTYIVTTTLDHPLLETFESDGRSDVVHCENTGHAALILEDETGKARCNQCDEVLESLGLDMIIPVLENGVYHHVILRG